MTINLDNEPSYNYAWISECFECEEHGHSDIEILVLDDEYEMHIIEHDSFCVYLVTDEDDVMLPLAFEEEAQAKEYAEATARVLFRKAKIQALIEIPDSLEGIVD